MGRVDTLLKKLGFREIPEEDQLAGRLLIMLDKIDPETISYELIKREGDAWHMTI